tara:strand:+ start:764 stop:1660 length:897 start_codon:yes stop_codon:yes gene_type:complete
MDSQLFVLTKKKRAHCLRLLRNFFHKNSVIEVDTCLLRPYPPIDTHIDIFEVDNTPKRPLFLHSSPEYEMKKLLAEGIGDIYQLGHVFRKEENGRYHQPEFTMIEWYRCGTCFDKFIEENIALLTIFLGKQDCEILTYDQVFEKYVGLKWDSPNSHLVNKARQINRGTYEDPVTLLWGCLVEPNLGQDIITVVKDFPPSQAALAQVNLSSAGKLVAERFEFYFNGIELGNGYHELTDPIEQTRRLEEENKKRLAMGKNCYEIDPEFISALSKGLPDCYGIALGFDRLMMFYLGLTHIH